MQADKKIGQGLKKELLADEKLGKDWRRSELNCTRNDTVVPDPSTLLDGVNSNIYLLQWFRNGLVVIKGPHVKKLSPRKQY